MSRLTTCNICPVSYTCDECSRKSTCFIFEEVQNPSPRFGCYGFKCMRYETCKSVPISKRERWVAIAMRGFTV